jgi:hypothetical protein
MRATIYQNCLALDYLLVEGCGKFNHSDFSLQIDNGQMVTNIATIRKIAHVPIWDGWKPNNWLGGWFSWLFPLLGSIAIIGAVWCFVHAF